MHKKVERILYLQLYELRHLGLRGGHCLSRTNLRVLVEDRPREGHQVFSQVAALVQQLAREQRGRALGLALARAPRTLDRLAHTSARGRAHGRARVRQL